MYIPDSIYLISILVLIFSSFHEIYIFFIHILYSEFLTLECQNFRTAFVVEILQFIKHYVCWTHTDSITGTMESLLVIYMALLLEDHLVLRHLGNDGWGLTKLMLTVLPVPVFPVTLAGKMMLPIKLTDTGDQAKAFCILYRLWKPEPYNLKTGRRKSWKKGTAEI